MKRYTVLFILMLMAMSLFSLAAPLKNMEVRLTQPDGQVINCFASGDEFYNYLHDANGFTIVKGANGYYVYADQDAQGNIVPSAFVVNSVDPASVGLRPYVKISEKAYLERRQAREQYIRQPKRPNNREINHGRYNNLVVFIRFAGETYHSSHFSNVEAMFNATGYEDNSLHNYYHHATYNQLDLWSYFYPQPDGETILSYEDIYPKEYYMPYDPTTNPMGYHDGETAEREFSLLERAIGYINDMVPDSIDFDYNDDGLVDNVVFVIKGSPGEWASLLWPHRWCIYDRYVPLKDLQVYDFNLQLEQGGYFNVSTLCHEMCHSLGAPDLYHYSTGIDPVGAWDLMCGTTEPPQHEGIYMKYKYGYWVDEIPEITEYGTYELESVAWEGNRRNAYKIATSNPYQFFVIENRNKKQLFDASLPNGGLLMYRIDTRYNGGAGYNGYDVFDEVYIFRTDGTIYQAGDLNAAAFSVESNRTEFSRETNPFPFLTNGQADNQLCIYNISKRGDRMSFTYGPLNHQIIPENLIAHVNSISHQVELSWDAVPDAGSYKVYRDDELVAEGLSENHFSHAYTASDNGYHQYHVTSVCGGEESFRSEKQWVILGPYETLRIGLTCDSPFGTKGGELEIAFSDPAMKQQYLTIYRGNANETEVHVPANVEVTFLWRAGFDPESQGIRAFASRINENSESVLFNLDSPEQGTIATYTVSEEGLGVATPQHLSVTLENEGLHLRWVIPTENNRFNLYRNDRLYLSDVTSYEFIDSQFAHSGTQHYQVSSMFGTGIQSTPSNTAHGTAMTFYCEPPLQLEGQHLGGSTPHNELTWQTPQFVGHGMLAYDDNQFVEQVGSNTQRWGIKFTPELLAVFEGRPLTHLEMFDCSEGTYTYTIYNGETTDNNTLLSTVQQAMTGSMGMVRIPLDEAVSYDPSLPLWICVQSTGASKPIPYGHYAYDPNSCLLKSGSNWRPATFYGLEITWLLRAYTDVKEGDNNFTYNVYWGPEEEEQLELGHAGLTATSLVHNTNENMRYNVTAVWNGKETDLSNTVFLGPSVEVEENTTADNDHFAYINNGDIIIEDEGMLQVFDMTGRVVAIHGDARSRVSTMGMAPGVYVLRLINAHDVKTQKIVIR